MLEFKSLKNKLNHLIKPIFDQLILKTYPESQLTKSEITIIYSYFLNELVNLSISTNDIEQLDDEAKLDHYIDENKKSILEVFNSLIEKDPFCLLKEKSKAHKTIPYLGFLTDLKKELYEKRELFIPSSPERFTPFQVWTMTHGLLASYFVKDVKKSDIKLPENFPNTTLSENLFAIFENPDNLKVAIFYGVSDKQLSTAKRLYNLYIQEHPEDACSELLFPTTEENEYNNPLYTLLGMINAKQHREHWIITWVNKNKEANCIDSKNIGSWFVYSLKNISELFPKLTYHFRGDQAILDNQKCGYFVVSYIFHLLLNGNLSTMDTINYTPEFNSHLQKLHLTVSFAYSQYEQLSIQYPNITFKEMLLNALKIDVEHLNNLEYTLQLMSKRDEDIDFETDCEQIEQPTKKLEECVLIVETDEQGNLIYYSTDEKEKSLEDSFSSDNLENYLNLKSETLCAVEPTTTLRLYNAALQKCGHFFNKPKDQTLLNPKLRVTSP